MQLRLTILCLCLCSFAGLASAQTRARMVNPSVIEFEVPEAVNPSTTCDIEVFPSDANLSSDRPTRVVSVRMDGAWARLDGKRLEDMPDGEYFAVVRIAQVNAAPVRTARSAPFVLAHDQGSALSAEERKRERFWTRVGFTIAGAILVIPFLVQ